MSQGGGGGITNATIKTLSSNEHKTTKKNRQNKVSKRKLWDQIENSFSNDCNDNFENSNKGKKK